MSRESQHRQALDKQAYACSHCSIVFRVNYREDSSVVCPGCENLISIDPSRNDLEETEQVVRLRALAKIDTKRLQHELGGVSLTVITLWGLLISAILIACVLIFMQLFDKQVNKRKDTLNKNNYSKSVVATFLTQQNNFKI